MIVMTLGIRLPQVNNRIGDRITVLINNLTYYIDGLPLGLSGLDEVFTALRDSAGRVAPEESIRQAATAVRRAEARAGEFFPEPLPPPCEVTPIPEVVAVSGAAPHYTPPRLDGGRPGTFWFNTRRPTAGTGGGGLFRDGSRPRYQTTPPSSPAHRPAGLQPETAPAGPLTGLQAGSP